MYQQNPSGKTNDGIRWKIRTYWQTLGISIANCQCLQKKLPKTIFELLHQRHAAVDLRSCGVATFDGWRDQAQLELWTSELGGTSGLEWSWNFWNSNGFSRCLKIIFLSKLLGFHVFQDVVSSWVHLPLQGEVLFHFITFPLVFVGVRQDTLSQAERQC